MAERHDGAQEFVSVGGKQAEDEVQVAAARVEEEGIDVRGGGGAGPEVEVEVRGGWESAVGCTREGC